FEIQQNSDTTYRVFDWNRTGLDGKPRSLHIQESLVSIDFNDFAPALISNTDHPNSDGGVRSLANHSLFRAQAVQTDAGQPLDLSQGKMHILGIVAGRVRVVS